jgi:site-specific recombinase XerD
MALAKLRPAHVSDWQAALAAGAGQDGASISPKTVFHARAMLGGMLAWAMKMSLVERNVVTAVDAPPVRRSQAKALEADEMARILAVAGPTRWSRSSPLRSPSVRAAVSCSPCVGSSSISSVASSGSKLLFRRRRA